MTFPRRLAAGVAGCALVALAACREDASPPPPVRPVLSVVVSPLAQRTFGFTGTIEPRYRVSLGFRLLGRLTARSVEVADQVKAGAVLAAIDPLALDLSVRSAEADVATVRAQLANATAVETRQRFLLERNVTSQAQFDSAQQAREAATAGVQQKEAALAKAREQLGYTQLRSDMDGVVTAVNAQVGQVVAPGTAVVTVARPDIREAAVDVPDEFARELKAGTPFDVALQLDPSIRIAGQVREIAPQADQLTRTRRILISLTGATDVFRLGTTITATVARQSEPSIDLPLPALLERDGRDFVWVIDPSSATVSTREVKVSRRGAESFQVADGLAAGTRVVTAGARSLAEGQTVKVPGEAKR